MINKKWCYQLLVISVFINLFSCRSTNYLSSLEVERITVEAANDLTPDPAITAMIQPYKVELDKEMNQVLGQAAVNLVKQRPEGTLGNWMADAIHRKTEAILGEPISFAIQNYGGIRINEITKGDITKSKVFEVMPFDNTIVVFSLNKMEVEELINHLIEARGWPVSYPIKVHKTAEKVSITINDSPLEEGIIYKVALPDYIANGGSRTYFLKGKTRQDLNINIRDALLEDVANFTKANKAIDSKIEGRFVIDEE